MSTFIYATNKEAHKGDQVGYGITMEVVGIPYNQAIIFVFKSQIKNPDFSGLLYSTNGFTRS